MEGNNMTQNSAIKLGVIAICFATVPWSLAQTPRTGTSRSNPCGAITGATAGHSGLIGNSIDATPLGTNLRSSSITAPNINAGARIGINAAAQAGISNQTGGIINGAASGLGGLSGNSRGATQIGTSARIGTNTTASTNVGAQTGIRNQTSEIINGPTVGLGGASGNSTGTTQMGTNARTGTNTAASANTGVHSAAAAATSASANIIQSQFIPVPIRSPLPNNSPVSSNFSTAGGSPSPVPSPSVTPTPTLTPAQLL